MLWKFHLLAYASQGTVSARPSTRSSDGTTDSGFGRGRHIISLYGSKMPLLKLNFNPFMTRLKLTKVSRLLRHSPSMTGRSELCRGCLVPGIRRVASIADHFHCKIIAGVGCLLNSVRLLLLTLIWRDAVELISRFSQVSLAPALPTTPLQGVLVLVPCKV